MITPTVISLQSSAVGLSPLVEQAIFRYPVLYIRKGCVCVCVCVCKCVYIYIRVCAYVFVASSSSSSLSSSSPPPHRELQKGISKLRDLMMVVESRAIQGLRVVSVTCVPFVCHFCVICESLVCHLCVICVSFVCHVFVFSVGPSFYVFHLFMCHVLKVAFSMINIIVIIFIIFIIQCSSFMTPSPFRFTSEPGQAAGGGVVEGRVWKHVHTPTNLLHPHTNSSFSHPSSSHSHTNPSHSSSILPPFSQTHQAFQ